MRITAERPERAYWFIMSLMQQPGARLVRTYSRNLSRNGYALLPNGVGVDRETAEAIIAHQDVRPCDAGLLPGHPQSWHLRTG